jgi:DNA repair exonuclease SbcCD ATPase subunit
MALLSVIPKPQDITIEGSSLMASRSSELEQKALDYEIASVLGEKRPAVTGTLTSRLFNIVTDPLDEYEIYGGLNVEFPVFDGGARDARVAGLNTQKVIVRSRLREELDRVDERWYELSAEFENTVSMLEQDERRLSTLRDRLDALKKRLEAVQVTINDLAEAELARTQAVRSIQSMEWSLLKIAVQKADAADKLYADLNVELPL